MRYSSSYELFWWDTVTYSTTKRRGFRSVPPNPMPGVRLSILLAGLDATFVLECRYIGLFEVYTIIQMVNLV